MDGHWSITDLSIAVFIISILLDTVTGDLQIVNSSNYPLPQRPLELEKGSTLDLRCISPQGRIISWTRSGASVVNLPRYAVIQENNAGVTVSRLTISDLQTNDSGMLQCSSSSDFIDVRLDIVSSEDVRWGSSVHITDPIMDVMDVNVGKPLFLTCKAGEGVKLKWYHHNQPLESMHPRLIITTGKSIEDRASYILLSRVSVRMENGGEYRCQDIDNPNNFDSVTVNIHESTAERTAITIMESASNQFHVYEGNQYTLKCRADVNTVLSWYLNDRLVIDSHDGFTIIEAPDSNRQLKTSILMREHADKQHEGTYTCINLNDQTDHDEVNLLVRRKGEERSVSGSIPTKVTQVIMQVGSSVKLQCSFGAPGEHVPEWTYDDNLLHHGDKYSVNMDNVNSMLTIQNAERGDTGMYKCSFRNQNTGQTDGIVEFNVSTAPCPRLAPPMYGSVDRCPPAPVYGESCTFRCNSGYIMSRSEAVVCEREVDTGHTYWDKNVPHCTHVSSLVDTSTVPTSVSDVLLRVGEELRLRCSQAGGWSKEESRLHTGRKYTVLADELVIKNAEMTDSGIYDCTIQQTDSNTIGIIKFNVTTLPCPPLSAPAHGSRDGCSAHPMYGDTCQFTCAEGYTLSGSRSRTCELAHSQTQVYWTGDVPICKSDNYVSWGEQINSAPPASPTASFLPLLTILCCVFMWQIH